MQGPRDGDYHRGNDEENPAAINSVNSINRDAGLDDPEDDDSGCCYLVVGMCVALSFSGDPAVTACMFSSCLFLSSFAGFGLGYGVGALMEDTSPQSAGEVGAIAGFAASLGTLCCCLYKMTCGQADNASAQSDQRRHRVEEARRDPSAGADEASAINRDVSPGYGT